jgi:hypothetical protein
MFTVAKGQPSGDAAGRYPAVVDGPRPAAEPTCGPDIAPHGGGVTVELRITPLRKNARRPARRVGPQRCRWVHWVSSPTVTNVIASWRPSISWSRCAGSWPYSQDRGGDVGVDDNSGHARPARREA